jgi:hypothetical protein
MKHMEKASAKLPHRLQAPKLSSLSRVSLSSRESLLKMAASSTSGGLSIEPTSPVGYYVYTICVAGVVRYIGKGKNQRLYCHMKEVRSRLKRDFRLRSIGSILQRNLTKAFLSGEQVTEQVLMDGLTEKEAYQMEYEKLREYAYAGKRDQLWNVFPDSIKTPQEIQAYTERLQRNLNSRDRWVRTLSAMTLEAGRGGRH